MFFTTLLSPGFAQEAYWEHFREEVFSLKEFTPDLHELEDYEWLNVFHYGDMMDGHSHEFLLDGKEALPGRTVAYTQEEYSVEKKALGGASFPIAYQYRKSPFDLKRPLRIRGELVKVRPYHFTVLDNHMRNTVEFIRKRVNVVVPLRKHNEYIERLVVVEAWMYFGIPSYFGQQEHWMFKPVAHYDEKRERPWSKSFYYFSKLECQTQANK